jgi:acyl-coenzyme A thioesterase 13
MSKIRQCNAYLTRVLTSMVSFGGLDTALKACKLVKATPGHCILSKVVASEHANRGGTLHGAFSAYLVDVGSTLALMSLDQKLPGVSLKMNFTYLKSAKIGQEIIIDARTVRKENGMAFLECEIKCKESGNLLVKGTHTQYVGSSFKW